MRMATLLGEAPKRFDGRAFDSASFTTRALASALGIRPADLYKEFWLENVFDEPQPTDDDGFDDFSLRSAVSRIRRMTPQTSHIICVGGRVARAMEIVLELPRNTIPLNSFLQVGSLWFGKIPHPASTQLSLATVALLRSVCTGYAPARQTLRRRH